MNRTQAIRKFYLWLHKGNTASVRDCPMTDHPLWPYRLGTKPENPRLSKPQAIRAACLDCAESPAHVKACRFHDCPLHEFRSGKRENPVYFASRDTNAPGEGKHTTPAANVENMASGSVL